MITKNKCFSMAFKVHRSSESDNAKIPGENNVACIFYAKSIVTCQPIVGLRNRGCATERC
jgi:hypothetical protein